MRSQSKIIVAVFDNYHNHGEHVAINKFFKDKKVNIKFFVCDNNLTTYFIKK